jgi:hypothetical protein
MMCRSGRFCWGLGGGEEWCRWSLCYAGEPVEGYFAFVPRLGLAGLGRLRVICPAAMREA